MMLSGLGFIAVFLAAIAAGMTNALAGGGTLITFPTLLAVGLPSIAANVTNTVALCPGYLGGTLAQQEDLRGQGKRLLWMLPVGVLGGVFGGYLLLASGEKIFRQLVPFLILAASGLLAIQEPLRKWLLRHSRSAVGASSNENAALLPVWLAAVYGGYFGAGMSVIILAVLGLVVEDTLTRLNALKQLIAFSVNVAAAIFFLFSGQVYWLVALVMACGALLGGAMGGRLAGRVKPATLRTIVVVIGLVVGVIYLVRG